MRIFLAIFLPFTVFLVHKKIGSAVACIVLQLLGLVLFAMLATLPIINGIAVAILFCPTFWAMSDIADVNADKKIKAALGNNSATNQTA